MRLPLSLLCTGLPNVRAKDLAACSEDDMSTGMMGLKLEATDRIDSAIRSLTNDVDISCQLLIDFVEDAFADLDAIDDIEDFVDALNSHGANIVHLTTRGRVERTSIKDDQVTLVIFELVCKNLQDCAIKFHKATVIIVKIFCLFNVDGVVENLLRSLHDLFLAASNLIVEVARSRSA